MAVYDKNGKVIKSAKEWRGVPGVKMIWHGEYSDPELEYGGVRRNYWDVEDGMYVWAKEDGIDAEDDESFNKYCQEHSDDVYEYFYEPDGIESACHGKSKKDKDEKKKAVKSSMSVRDLPREALQELKERYYMDKFDNELSYGEIAAIDDLVSDEEVFDEYDGTTFTEDDFLCLANSRKPVKSSKRPIKSAVDGGWEVDSSEANDAYDFAMEYFGEDELNRQIIQALGTDELAACLAYIFRMNDFREWDEYKDNN